MKLRYNELFAVCLWAVLVLNLAKNYICSHLQTVSSPHLLEGLCSAHTESDSGRPSLENRPFDSKQLRARRWSCPQLRTVPACIPGSSCSFSHHYPTLLRRWHCARHLLRGQRRPGAWHFRRPGESD